jgi:hypothetical protein
MVSLPMDYIHRSCLQKKDPVTVAYSSLSVLISAKKTWFFF